MVLMCKSGMPPNKQAIDFETKSVAATTNPMHILAADADNHRVQVFGTDGNYAIQSGSLGTGNGQFQAPNEITSDNTVQLFENDDHNLDTMIFINKSIMKTYKKIKEVDKFDENKNKRYNRTILTNDNDYNYRNSIEFKLVLLEDKVAEAKIAEETWNLHMQPLFNKRGTSLHQ